MILNCPLTIAFVCQRTCHYSLLFLLENRNRPFPYPQLELMLLKTTDLSYQLVNFIRSTLTVFLLFDSLFFECKHSYLPILFTFISAESCIVNVILYSYLNFFPFHIFIHVYLLVNSHIAEFSFLLGLMQHEILQTCDTCL